MCRNSLGLKPDRLVALVMGGSQGAQGINELVIQALPLMARIGPDWQWFHLSGAAGLEKVRQAYAAHKLQATVHPFFAEMDLVMGAACAAISRAGASSLAELAAVRLPSVLIPYPAATDNHQFHNASAFQSTGAARLLEQQNASPELLARTFGELMLQEAVRQQMQKALTAWDRPHASEHIAQALLEAAGMRAQIVRSSARKDDHPPKNLDSSCWRTAAHEGRPAILSCPELVALDGGGGK